MSVGKPSNRVFLWTYGLLGLLTIAACVLFEQHRAGKEAENFLQQWVAAEYFNLQEGNLLESTAKLNRALVAGVKISGVEVVDLDLPQAPLVQFGEVADLPTSVWEGLTSSAQSTYCGFLAPCVSMLLPTRTATFGIALRMGPHGSFTSLALFAAGMMFLTLMGMVFITRQNRSSHQRAIGAINDIFARAIENSPAEMDHGKISFVLEHPLSETFKSLCLKIESGAKADAVARMTGMMAHDVRKPFSILRMGLGMLGSAKDPEGVKRVLSRLVPEIDKAVSSVDGLIADVMEVGSTSTQLIQEPTAPETLIEATLGEAFRIYPKAAIAISYEFGHRQMVNVHVQKVSRIFSNIVGNAIQAMGYKGEIWFKTRQKDGFIEFCIGNAGSVIPPESLPKLFEAFFTSGKKGGTGLGLAIAQKVVVAHGGRIWCESCRTPEHPNGKVEFLFTLPVAEKSSLPSVATHLPVHSSEVIKAAAVQANAAPSDGGTGSITKGEVGLEAEVIAAGKALARSLRVLIVDDEDVYRQALAASLARTPELTNALVIRMASGSPQALELAGKADYDLVVTDVDMGPTSLHGFDLVPKLRALKGAAGAIICIHSNRVVTEDHRTAIESGADAFISKPASREQLLKLVLQSFKRGLATRQAVELASSEPVLPPPRPQVLLVDDNPFILEAWEDALRDEATVHALTSYEALVERLEADPGFAAGLLLAVTDMHLDGSAGDGLDVGRLLKKHRAGLRVLLSSDGVLVPGEMVGAIDRAIGKDPVNLGTLQSL